MGAAGLIAAAVRSTVIGLKVDRSVRQAAEIRYLQDGACDVYSISLPFRTDLSSHVSRIEVTESSETLMEVVESQVPKGTETTATAMTTYKPVTRVTSIETVVETPDQCFTFGKDFVRAELGSIEGAADRANELHVFVPEEKHLRLKAIVPYVLNAGVRANIERAASRKIFVSTLSEVSMIMTAIDLDSPCGDVEDAKSYSTFSHLLSGTLQAGGINIETAINSNCYHLRGDYASETRRAVDVRAGSVAHQSKMVTLNPTFVFVTVKLSHPRRDHTAMPFVIYEAFVCLEALDEALVYAQSVADVAGIRPRMSTFFTQKVKAFNIPSGLQPIIIGSTQRVATDLALGLCKYRTTLESTYFI